ncbi:hypothetical protein PybrP1_002991 [[Pythium] brassicae (nom. inval.)]|nr:hypothetical protein PybrP1_002991 [[Pythium] brassicae (nom. inval.)]
MADKQLPETVVEVDAHDGRGFQPVVDSAAAQVAALNVGDDEDAEDLEDDLASLPANVQLRIVALRKLQEQHAELEEQFEKERKQLELKYEKLYQPFYRQRAEIVTGAKEVDAVVDSEVASDEDANVKGVPGFWLRAFMNHSALADLIHERDLPAFEYLLDVRSASHEDDNGFKLEFDFAENPFFANTTLSKEYVIGDASEAGEAVLQNVTGTAIEWRAGKNLCEVTKKVKQRAKGGKGETRVVTRTEPAESFFQFFTPVDMPSEEEDDDNDLIMRQLTGDFEIGFLIHETIIPQALLWFTGEAVEEDDSEYDPEDDYDDDEDDDDDESDDDAPRARKPKKKHPALDSAKSTEKPPECKNQ